MEDALRKEDSALLWTSIRENHRLLSDIGVVPHRVQHLIAEIENVGGAAKICGAGSVSGDHAGVVWVYGNSLDMYQQIASAHQMDWMGTLMLCPKGAQSCPTKL